MDWINDDEWIEREKRMKRDDFFYSNFPLGRMGTLEKLKKGC
jgi:hypothetical protein